MPEDRLTFKEMCAAFEVTPRTLRYYEYIELLQPEREGRARYYSPRESARMKLILRGRKFGFALEDIRHIKTYFSDLSPRSSENVLDDIAETIDTLALFPKVGRLMTKNSHRRIVTPRYRYVIAYIASSHKVEIIGVVRQQNRET